MNMEKYYGREGGGCLLDNSDPFICSQYSVGCYVMTGKKSPPPLHLNANFPRSSCLPFVYLHANTPQNVNSDFALDMLEGVREHTVFSNTSTKT